MKYSRSISKKFGGYQFNKDLTSRSDNREGGISKSIFQQYYNLPGIIGDRLFNYFDLNKNNYISKTEFVNSMSTIFAGEFHELVKLTFFIYDFNEDGKISKEDISTVMSYIPLNSSYLEKRLKLEASLFKQKHLQGQTRKSKRNQ